jgi:hypothetical protein
MRSVGKGARQTTSQLYFSGSSRVANSVTHLSVPPARNSVVTSITFRVSDGGATTVMVDLLVSRIQSQKVECHVDGLAVLGVQSDNSKSEHDGGLREMVCSTLISFETAPCSA